MKKQTVSFQFDTVPAHSRPLHLTDAAAGVLLLAGIWGLLWQCLRPESVPGLLGLGALAALGLAAGLLLRWDRKWQRAALCGALLVLLAAGILLRSHISAALAGLGDLWGQWRFRQTGRYTPPYVGAGSVGYVYPRTQQIKNNSDKQSEAIHFLITSLLRICASYCRRVFRNILISARYYSA